MSKGRFLFALGFASATPTTMASAPTSTSTGIAGPTSSPAAGGGGGPTSSPLLFFVALGFGVVFTNLWYAERSDDQLHVFAIADLTNPTLGLSWASNTASDITRETDSDSLQKRMANQSISLRYPERTGGGGRKS